MEPTLNHREASIMAMYVTKTKFEIQFQTHLRTRTRPIYIYGGNFKVQGILLFFEKKILNSSLGKVWNKGIQGGSNSNLPLFLVIY